MDREAGKEFSRWRISAKQVDGVNVLNHESFRVNKGDRSLLLVKTNWPFTALFKILEEEITADSGMFKWGVSTHAILFS